MTVADDLATLRDAPDSPFGPGDSDRYYAALARVEAEIARLEQEWRHAATVASEHLLTAARQEARAEAAEAEIARLRDGLRSAKWAINLGVGCARDLGDDKRLAALLEAEAAARALLAEDDAA